MIELCRRGDAGWVDRAVPNWHFTWLFEGVLPALRAGGVTDEQIATMLEGNPMRWLAGSGTPASVMGHVTSPRASRRRCPRLRNQPPRG